MNSTEFKTCILGSLSYSHNASMEFTMNFTSILRLHGTFLDTIPHEFCRLNIINGDTYTVLTADMGVMLSERHFTRASL